MPEQMISIEINGNAVPVGMIVADRESGVCFKYDDTYLNSNVAAPISISLPLQKEAFSEKQTKRFFEGLLPEGFTKRTVANWLHVEENDYLSILGALGKECLGAIMVSGDTAKSRFSLEDSSSVFSADRKSGDGSDSFAGELGGRPGYEALSLKRVEALAREGATVSADLVTKAHLSLTGASGKVGLYLHDGDWYLPKGSAPSTHIVKQSHVRLDSIVLNEHLALMTAKELGMEVSENFVVNVGDGLDGDVLFASTRYDRCFGENSTLIDGLKRPYRLHQEDFAQAMGIASADKYEKAGEQHMASMFQLLRKYSAKPLEDSIQLWDMIVFDFLIGNTDNHVKNCSLLYSADLKSVRLAPAYDILSTCIYESSTRDMAFRIGDRLSLDEIDRNAFEEAAQMCGLGRKMAMKRFDDLAERFELGLDEAAKQLTSEGLPNAASLRERILKNCGYARVMK